MDTKKENDNSKENKADEEDTRVTCKYGGNCYQKNPEHHKKYKHSPKNKEKEEDDENNSRKRKSPEGEKSISDDEAPKNKKQNVSSTSETEEKTKESPKTETENDSNTKTEEKVAKIEKEEASKVETPIKIQENLEDDYSEAKKLISKIFFVTMPKDFYKFYEFCNELKPSDPSSAFKIADLKLVGPYDVLTGLINKNTPNQTNLLCHWRYYYDPPEFQTIVKGNDKDGLHFGYWRDRPSSEPVFVATNCSNVSHKIKPIAENIFGAVTNYLEERTKKANPFEKTGFFNLLAKLKAYAKKFDITLESQTAKMKAREKNVVARTIHGAGIVCPYNKKSKVGYRELSVTDNQLLKIIKKIDDAKDEEERAGARSELAEIERLATIAGDECDFGTCLELGHDLLSVGSPYVQSSALSVLDIAYNQLDRQPFLKIVQAHMKNRKKGCNLNVLSTAQKN